MAYNIKDVFYLDVSIGTGTGTGTGTGAGAGTGTGTGTGVGAGTGAGTGISTQSNIKGFKTKPSTLQNLLKPDISTYQPNLKVKGKDISSIMAPDIIPASDDVVDPLLSSTDIDDIVNEFWSGGATQVASDTAVEGAKELASGATEELAKEATKGVAEEVTKETTKEMLAGAVGPGLDILSLFNESERGVGDIAGKTLKAGSMFAGPLALPTYGIGMLLDMLS